MKNPLLKSIILFTLYISVGYTIQAQTPQIRYGDREFHQFNFQAAVQIYQNALRKDTGSVYLRSRIADCYRLMGDPVNAEKYYATLAKDHAVDPINKLYYAQALRSNRKYAQAAEVYQSYLDYTNRPNAAVLECAEGARQVTKMSKDNGRYLIENMHEVNSKGADFAATFFAGKSIWFTSNRDRHQVIRFTDNWSGAGFLRGYTSSSLATRVYDKPVMMKSKGFNKSYHEGPACYDRTTSELYITRSNVQRKKQETIRTKLYKVSCDPQYGFFTGAITEAVPFNSNEYSVMHPTISSDGHMMIFASDMPAKDAQGGTDLYVSMRDAGGHWGMPQNMGSDINTFGDEMFPYIGADSALYFSSDGHAGLGGLDIYRSFMLPDGQWSKPKNIGAPVNTSYDDFSYVIDERGINGMFASSKPGGAGGDDLYSFVRTEINVIGQVVDALTLQPVEDVKVTLREDNTTESTDDKTDRHGGCCFAVKPHTHYTLSTSRLGYVPREVSVPTRDGTTRRTIYITRLGAVHMLVTIQDAVTQRPVRGSTGIIRDMVTGESADFRTDATGIVYADIVLNHQYKIDVDQKPAGNNKYYLSEVKVVSSESLVNGDTLKVTMDLHQNTVNYVASLKNIYFDLDKWNIRPDATIELDKAVAILKDNPVWHIQVAAHTDCRETEQYNMVLSQRRAGSVVSYLTAHGIAASRLSPVGFGKTVPAIPCICTADDKSDCTEEQHAMNRRVEFVIMNNQALSEAGR